MNHENASPLVSVIIATCKRDDPAYLREAVSSVLNQTYRNIEALIVLDGEIGDDTRGYLESAAQNDSRARIIPLPQNVGPALARNAAIAQAAGFYTAILDADDRAAPERIAAQCALMAETGADLLGSQYRLVDESGEIIGEKRVPTTPEAVRATLCLFNPIANSTVFARTELLKQHPYRDVAKLGARCFGEDYDLWVTLAREGFVLRNHPAYLVDFRTNSRFVNRRRGWRVFTADLRTKLRTLPLYAPLRRPLMVLVAFATAATRLLPSPALNILYRVRNALRFHVSSE